MLAQVFKVLGLLHQGLDLLFDGQNLILLEVLAQKLIFHPLDYLDG